MKNLNEYLPHLSKMDISGTFEKFISSAQEFEKIELAETLGTPKQCFSNSGKIAMDSDRYKYVEGFVFSLIPFHHAWLWDTEKNIAIETTLKEPASEYFGVIFEKNELIDHILKHKYWGDLIYTLKDHRRSKIEK